MSVIVHVENGVGFRAYAHQGHREHEAHASSPSFAAQLAAAGLLGREASVIQVERKAPGVWVASEKKGGRS